MRKQVIGDVFFICSSVQILVLLLLTYTLTNISVQTYLPT